MTVAGGSACPARASERGPCIAPGHGVPGDAAFRTACRPVGRWAGAANLDASCQPICATASSARRSAGRTMVADDALGDHRAVNRRVRETPRGSPRARSCSILGRNLPGVGSRPQATAGRRARRDRAPAHGLCPAFSQGTGGCNLGLGRVFPGDLQRPQATRCRLIAPRPPAWRAVRSRRTEPSRCRGTLPPDDSRMDRPGRLEDSLRQSGRVEPVSQPQLHP